MRKTPADYILRAFCLERIECSFKSVIGQTFYLPTECSQRLQAYSSEVENVGHWLSPIVLAFDVFNPCFRHGGI